jgi:hypothetical protein
MEIDPPDNSRTAVVRSEAAQVGVNGVGSRFISGLKVTLPASRPSALPTALLLEHSLPTQNIGQSGDLSNPFELDASQDRATISTSGSLSNSTLVIVPRKMATPKGRLVKRSAPPPRMASQNNVSILLAQLGAQTTPQSVIPIVPAPPYAKLSSDSVDQDLSNSTSSVDGSTFKLTPKCARFLSSLPLPSPTRIEDPIKSSTNFTAQPNEAAVAQNAAILAPEPSILPREPVTAKMNELLEAIPYKSTERIEDPTLVTASLCLEPITMPRLSVKIDAKTLPAPAPIQDIINDESGSQLPVSTSSLQPHLPKVPETFKIPRVSALSKADAIAGSPAHLKSKGDSVESFIRAFEKLNKKLFNTGNRTHWINNRDLLLHATGFDDRLWEQNGGDGYKYRREITKYLEDLKRWDWYPESEDRLIEWKLFLEEQWPEKYPGLKQASSTENETVKSFTTAASAPGVESSKLLGQTSIPGSQYTAPPTKPAPASPFNFNRTIALDSPSLAGAFIPFTVDQRFNAFNVSAHTGPVEPEEEPRGIILRENIREAAKRYGSTLRPKPRALNTAQTSAISQPQANLLAPTTDSVMNPFNPALFKSFPKQVLPTGPIFGSASNTLTRAPFKIVTDFNGDSFHAYNMQPCPSKKADVPAKTENTPLT